MGGAGTDSIVAIFVDANSETQTSNTTEATWEVPQNLPPTANAGVDQIVEQQGPTGSNVTLSGSGSSDLDGDTLTYSWSTGDTVVNPTVFLGAGTHTITLVVNDGTVDSAPDTVQITVRDNIAPAITTTDRTEEATDVSTPVDISGDASATDAVGVASLTNDNAGPYPVGSTTVTWEACDAAGNCSTETQTVTIIDTTPPEISNACLTDKLWPPNHKLVLVSTGSVSDIADPNATFDIVVTSNQPINGTGDGNTDPDWVVDSSSSDYEVSLRAERAGNIGQRDYTTTVTATDASGNTSTATCSASVPHDQGKNKGGKK